jgi:hypothetical protein
MQNIQLTQNQKLLGLLLIVCLVIGFFYLQHSSIVARSTPQPTPTPIAAQSGNITVSVPYYEGSVPPDFLVRGKARVFENVVSIRVSNRVLGRVYFTGTTMTNATDAGQFGNFVTQIHLNTTDNTLRPNDKLTLEVFQASPKDGQEIDKVSIPLYFSPQLP